MTEQFIQVHERAIAIYNFDNEKYVAIKPICEAIGVNYSTQLEKIEKDEILSSVVPLRGIVGADKKTREMRVIPLRYVFGWLFTINPKNVNPDIKEKVFKYRMECYNALYDTFTKRTGILRQKAEIQTKLHKLEEEIKADERYQEMLRLKQELSGTTKALNSMDKGVLEEQLGLFEEKQ